MIRPRRLTGMLSALTVTLALPGCLPAEDVYTEARHAFATAYLREAIGLEPPVIAAADDVYKPSTWLTVDGVGEVATLRLVVAVDDAAALQIRLRDQRTEQTTPLRQYEAPPDFPRAVFPPSTLPPDLRTALTEGPVFYLATAQPDPLALPVTFLIPADALGAFTQLELFTGVTPDGRPAGAARVDLVQNFFYSAVLGDSVQWGNGLREADKISTLVHATIERELGRRVISQRFAQSGAQILPDEEEEAGGACTVGCWGEVPGSATTITAQVTLIDRPAFLDLVIMDGCINDVGVGTIIDPRTGVEELAELSDEFCFTAMRDLLLELRNRAPNAAIVVTGYFPVIGPQSDPFALLTWAPTLGLDLSDRDAQTLAEMEALSNAFVRNAHADLAAAAEAVDITATAPVAFVDPEFGPKNAVFSPEKWLWSLTEESDLLDFLEVDLELFPEDPIQDLRLAECLETLGFDFEDIDITQIPAAIGCIYASVGHPNPAGARQYANAIVVQLRELGLLPAAPE